MVCLRVPGRRKPLHADVDPAARERLGLHVRLEGLVTLLAHLTVFACLATRLRRRPSSTACSMRSSRPACRCACTASCRGSARTRSTGSRSRSRSGASRPRSATALRGRVPAVRPHADAGGAALVAGPSRPLDGPRVSRCTAWRPPPSWWPWDRRAAAAPARRGHERRGLVPLLAGGAPSPPAGGGDDGGGRRGNRVRGRAERAGTARAAAARRGAGPSGATVLRPREPQPRGPRARGGVAGRAPAGPAHGAPDGAGHQPDGAALLRPVVGYGPETLQGVFGAVYDPAFARAERRNPRHLRGGRVDVPQPRPRSLAQRSARQPCRGRSWGSSRTCSCRRPRSSPACACWCWPARVATTSCWRRCARPARRSRPPSSASRCPGRISAPRLAGPCRGMDRNVLIVAPVATRRALADAPLVAGSPRRCWATSCACSSAPPW